VRRRRGDGSVTKRKDGRFEAAAYVHTPSGIKRVRRYAVTRPEAEAMLVELRNKNRSGLLTNSREQKLGDYLDYWLTVAKSKLRPTTYTSYEGIVRLYLKPGLGNKCLARLSVADVQSHINSQLQAGVSNRTIQKQRLILSSALKRAEHEDIISRNVARLVDIPQYRPKEIVPWNLNQLNIFLDHASSDPLYPVFVMLAFYGLRTSEALGLTWHNIDTDNKVIHIRQQLQYYDQAFHYTDLKTQAGRRDLPILDITHNVLQNITQTDSGVLPDLIFKTTNGNPIDRRNMLRSFKRISKHAGLPLIRMHDLRHTAATILKDIGIPARDTQLILGHAHITTTQQIYQHSGIEERVLILERYEQKLVSISACSRQIKPSSDIQESKILKNNIGSSKEALDINLRLTGLWSASLPVC
jgi:integrase